MFGVFGREKRSNTDIQVLVLGNRAAGKTSLLATMLYKMNEMSEKLKGIVFRTLDEETEESLKESIAGMEEMFLAEDDVGVGQGIAGTDGFRDYRFYLGFDGKEQECSHFRLIFHDHRGSMLTEGKRGGWEYKQLKKYFQQSQVICVLIEAPYLMQSQTREDIDRNSAKKEILTLFRELGDDDEGKLFVIVPTKCEYYIHNGQIDQVKKELKYQFRELMDAVREWNDETRQCRMILAPVQTMGGLEFSRMEGDRLLFRRTKPGSVFEPRQTDLLLLYCMEYVLGGFLDRAVRDVSNKGMKTAVKKIRRQDDEKKLGDVLEEWDNLRGRRWNRSRFEDRRKAIFQKILYSFFDGYFDRESRIKPLCSNEKISECWKFYDCGRRIREDYGAEFQKYFEEIE